MVYSEITKQEFLWANFEQGCTPWKRESTGLRYTWKAHSPVVDIVNRFHGMTREKAEGVLIARRSLNRPGWLSTIDVTATRMTQPAPTMEDMRFSDRGRLPAVDRSPLSFPSVLLLSSHSFEEDGLSPLRDSFRHYSPDLARPNIPSLTTPFPRTPLSASKLRGLPSPKGNTYTSSLSSNYRPFRGGSQRPRIKIMHVISADARPFDLSPPRCQQTPPSPSVPLKPWHYQKSRDETRSRGGGRDLTRRERVISLLWLICWH